MYIINKGFKLNINIMKELLELYNINMNEPFVAFITNILDKL